MNFQKRTCQSFLDLWRAQPKATLHWVLPKEDEGRWEMRHAGKVVMTHIPMEVGDWVWRTKQLARDVFPDPHARDCVWHLELKP